MKIASLKEIKTALSLMENEELVTLCLRTAKFKKDNKELINYILFESGDEANYIESAKEEMKEQMSAINTSNLYLAKKTVRKVLRLTQKYMKYSETKTTKIELLIAFCKLLKSTGLPLTPNTVLGNIDSRQMLLLGKLINDLHEDLQYDYHEVINDLLLTSR